MYQNFINLLTEAGYQKYMSEAGPVYLLEKGEERQIIFLTYHKNQLKEPIHLQEYEAALLRVKETVFSQKEAKLLCILIVDDGKLLEEQINGKYPFSVWIQDEISGKLYMNEASKKEFFNLYHFLEQKGEAARKIMEEQQEQEKTEKKEWKLYLTPVNMMLILVNAIAFGLYLLWGDPFLQKGVSIWMDILLDQEYYRLFTSLFLHFDAEHFMSNMLILFLTGSFAERYLGSFKYLAAYLGSGLAGNMLSFYMEIGSTKLVWAAGASGAIYGVLGLLAVILIKTRGRLEGMYGPGLFLLVVGSIFHSYQNMGVDNWAHLGGLLAGICFGIFLSAKKKES